MSYCLAYCMVWPDPVWTFFSHSSANSCYAPLNQVGVFLCVLGLFVFSGFCEMCSHCQKSVIQVSWSRKQNPVLQHHLYRQLHFPQSPLINHHFNGNMNIKEYTSFMFNSAFSFSSVVSFICQVAKIRGSVSEKPQQALWHIHYRKKVINSIT